MILLLLWVFLQDIKERQVTLVLLLSLILLGGFLHYKKQILEIFLLNILVNTMTILVVVFILWMYSKLKLKSELFHVFGTGDLLFFLFLAVSFPITTFLVVFSSSLIFSLIVSIVLKNSLKKWIPLAGLQALFLSLLIGANQLFHIVNLYAL
jgi:hypothetical protein